jgi:hypothetical protein
VTTDNRLPFGLRQPGPEAALRTDSAGQRKFPLYTAAQSGGNSGLPDPRISGSQTEPICKPAPPAGFIFSDGRDADENPFTAQAAHREPAQTDGAARISRAHRCAIFPTLPKLRALPIRRSGGRRRRLLRPFGDFITPNVPAGPGPPGEYNRHFVPSKSLTQT